MCVMLTFLYILIGLCLASAGAFLLWGQFGMLQQGDTEEITALAKYAQSWTFIALVLCAIVFLIHK